MTQTARIRTNLKFYKGLDNMADRIYSLVTKVNGSWRGCKHDCIKKKIVLVDAGIANSIIPNVLYYCTLVPMRKDEGFIVKSAKVVQFEATICSVCRKKTFAVNVKFGNKLYVYDPASKDSRQRDIQRIAGILRNRVDLLNASQVAEDFIDSACMVKHMYQQTLEDVH